MVAQSQYNLDLESSSSASSASGSHFGGNIVATRNGVMEGSPFQTGTEQLGLTSIRYPGGTVTEQYFDPNGTVWEQLFGADRSDVATATDGTTVLGPKPFFDFANQNGHSVTFVLPTATLLTTGPNGTPVIDASALLEVRSVVREIIQGNFGSVKIDSFEIGNEYYHYAGMTAHEYGMVANELVRAIGDEFQTFENQHPNLVDWDRPEIAIQAGAGWQEGDNETIIGSLDDDVRGLIDRVSIHYYPQDLDQVDKYDGIFSQINAWEGATGFGELNFFASEWNIQASPGSDTGMGQASSLVAAFDEMLQEGIDSASIWGVQNRWLDTSLTTLNLNSEVDSVDPDVRTRLTVSGEIFASMAESLPGLRSFEIDRGALLARLSVGGQVLNTASHEIEINSFGSEGRAVIYISSRSDEVIHLDLNLDQYFDDPSHLWGEVLTAVDDPTTQGRDESDPLDPRGMPVFESVNQQQLGADDTITLAPHAIIRINVQLDGSGVTMLGHDPLIETNQEYADTFLGSTGDDSINGYAGDDHLNGLLGDDAINGDRGNDIIVGGMGNDVARGGEDDDRLEGQAGNDVLFGGANDDLVFGGQGDDVISGGDGDDTIVGGAGNDLIFSGSGQDTISGGSGTDYFVASANGQTVITDWEFDSGDKITFLGQFEDADHLSAHAVETAGIEGQAGNLILSNGAGGEITFVGGAGHLDQLLGQVVDFTEAGQSALELADDINDMSGREIGTFLDSMSSEEFADQILAPDPIILLASMDAGKAAQFISHMNPEEGLDFFENAGHDGLAAFFEELDVPEAQDFVSAVSKDALVGFLDVYGGSEFLSRLDDCNEATRTTFFEKIDGSKYDYLAEGHTEVDPTDSGLPEVPVDEETDEQTDEDDSADANSMACFVATVAYHDADHADVWTLRWYRDNILRTYFLGRLFIRMYWIVGPCLAETLKNRPNLIWITRVILSIFVRFMCAHYNRTPGRQLDHLTFSSSRSLTWSDCFRQKPNGSKREGK